MTRRVVVVGAGVAGASVADHLARETAASVLVLDRSPAPATETTAKSGAFVGFWGHESTALVPLLRYGIDFYGRLLSEHDGAARFVHGGRLRLATSDAGDAALRADFDAWFGTHTARPGDENAGETRAPTTRARGAPVQYLPGERLGETLVVPDLDTDAVTGALYSPGVGHVDAPRALARTLLERATAAGATVETDATVTSILTGRATGDGDAGTDARGDPDGGHRCVRGVRVDGDPVRADAVVAAAGPWNRRLLSSAGVDLPVRNTRGPMLAVDTDAHGLPALYHEETGVYTRTNRDGTLYVGHFPGEYDDAERLDPDDVSDAVPERRRRRCLDVVERLCPGLGVATAGVDDEWVGVRTLTPDGLPVVGGTDVAGLSVVAFNANGIQYAPAAGRILAAQIGEAVDADLPAAPLALGRFR